MFMSLFVIYGFDTAGTLAEETRDPRREAPKAIIGSIIGAFVIGGIFLYACLLAIPNLKDAIKGGFGPAPIIDANFSNAFSTVFLLVVSAAIFVCCLSIQTSTIRLCFGMSRDDRLPASALLEGASAAAHADRLVHRDRRPRVHPDAPVRGRRDHRDRGDGDDLPRVLHREPRAPARAARGLAEDEGAVLARQVGPAAERARPRLGRRHARQLRLAAGRASSRTRRPTSGRGSRSTSTGTG